MGNSSRTGNKLLGKWTLDIILLSELTWQSSPFTTRGGSPWSQESRVLVPNMSLTSCVESYFSGCRAAVSCLVTKVQHQFRYVRHPQQAPPSSWACNVDILPSTSHPTLHTLGLYFSTFRAARLSSSLYELFPLLECFCSSGKHFSLLSRQESISLKLTLTTSDRCKFFLFSFCTSLRL